MSQTKTQIISQDSGAGNWQFKNFRAPQTLPMEYPSMANRSQSGPTSIFRSTYQSGFLSVLYAIGQRPLELWEKQVRNGHVKRITDADIRSLAIEVLGTNVSTTFITTPVSPQQALGIRLPIIVFVIKNLKRYFVFEVQISDDTATRRRFSCSNFISNPKIRSFSAQLPLRLEDGWNQISLNLSELTRKIFGTGYQDTVRIQVHANIRIRRIYFCDKVYGEDEVPADFKVFVMNSNRKTSSSSDMEQQVVPSKPLSFT